MKPCENQGSARCIGTGGGYSSSIGVADLVIGGDADGQVMKAEASGRPVCQPETAASARRALQHRPRQATCYDCAFVGLWEVAVCHTTALVIDTYCVCQHAGQLPSMRLQCVAVDL